MPEQFSDEDLELAEQLRAQANLLTAARDKAAHIIGPAIMVYGPNWPTAIVSTGAVLTDYFDGKKARDAEQLGISPTREDGESDHLADKKLTYFSLVGILLRDIVDSNYISASVIGGVIATNIVRDAQMARLRTQAASAKISTDAIKPNKIKSVILDVGIVLASAPISDSKNGRATRNSVFAGGTALGVYGLKAYKKIVEKSTKIA